MSIEAMKQWRAALEVAYDQTCSVGRPKDWKQIKDALDSVNAAISQAQGGKAGEAVAWRIHPHDYGIGSAGVYAMTQIPQQVDAWLKKGWTPEPLYTHPAPGVPEDVVRDAERYRWLKAYDQNSEDMGICKWVDEGWSGQWVIEHDPDSAIDHARTTHKDEG